MPTLSLRGHHRSGVCVSRHLDHLRRQESGIADRTPARPPRAAYPHRRIHAEPGRPATGQRDRRHRAARAGGRRRDNVIFLSNFLSDAQSEEEQLSRTGEIDHQTIIREHAGWNMDCATIAHPALCLNEPPDHGRVCARIENIKVHSIYVGTESQCIGRVVRGVQLIYRPDPGYAGNDALRFAAQYPSILRMVSVMLTVTGIGRRGAIEPDHTCSATRQSSGPVPACDELIF